METKKLDEKQFDELNKRFIKKDELERVFINTSELLEQARADIRDCIERIIPNWGGKGTLVRDKKELLYNTIKNPSTDED